MRAARIITFTKGTNSPKNIQIDIPLPKSNMLLSSSINIQN